MRAFARIAAGTAGVLTIRQLAVLESLIGMAEPATVRGLAAALGFSKPVITRATATLRESGLLAKWQDPSDGRSVLIALTDEGTGLWQTISEIIEGEAL